MVRCVWHGRVTEPAVASVAVHVTTVVGSGASRHRLPLPTHVSSRFANVADACNAMSIAIRWRSEWKSKPSWYGDGAWQILRNRIHPMKPRKTRVGTTVQYMYGTVLPLYMANRETCWTGWKTVGSCGKCNM